MSGKGRVGKHTAALPEKKGEIAEAEGSADVPGAVPTGGHSTVHRTEGLPVLAGDGRSTGLLASGPPGLPVRSGSGPCRSVEYHSTLRSGSPRSSSSVPSASALRLNARSAARSWHQSPHPARSVERLRGQPGVSLAAGSDNASGRSFPFRVPGRKFRGRGCRLLPSAFHARDP